MLEENARAYHDLGALITAITNNLKLSKTVPEGPDFEAFVKILKTCRDRIGELKLSVSYEYISLAMTGFNSNHLKQIAMDQVAQLSVVIMSELKGRALFRFDAERVQYYDQPALFGDDVNLKFPEAATDIREAGSCYALERTTACVLHLMRVLDLALKALINDPNLAPKLGISWAPKETMGSLAKKLETVASKWPEDTSAEATERTELLEVALHFKLVTEAWRNKNFHTDAEYNSEQAMTIFRHVKQFMAHLTKLLQDRDVVAMIVDQTKDNASSRP